MIERLGRLFELGDGNSRWSAMEGLRGLAIALVLVCHYIAIIGPSVAPHTSELLRVICQSGGAGVDLFFALSGLLIYKAAMKPNLSYTSFIGRRIERIYPAFLSVLAIYCVLGAIHMMPFRAPEGTNLLLYLGENLIFIPGIFDVRATISAAWSLSYEWAFYLCLPLFVIALHLASWRSTSRIRLFVGVSVTYLMICLCFAPSFPQFEWWDGTRVRLLMFLTGMIVAELMQRSSAFSDLRFQRGLLATAITGMCLLALVEFAATPALREYAQPAWLRLQSARVAVLFAICIPTLLITLPPGSIASQIFSFAPLRWLGNMSYSVYLAHSLALHVVAQFAQHYALHGFLAYFALFPIALAVILLSSAILFAAIERPLSLSRRIGKIENDIHVSNPLQIDNGGVTPLLLSDDLEELSAEKAASGLQQI